MEKARAHALKRAMEKEMEKHGEKEMTGKFMMEIRDLGGGGEETGR